MEAREGTPSLQTVFADARSVRERTRGRLSDRGLDPDRVLDTPETGDSIDLATFYDIIGTTAASEKAGQSPTYALARLALCAGLPAEIADTLFLAYNQQSAEEAGHGDKVFANAYFAMGGAAPSGDQSAVGNGGDVATMLAPSEDPRENKRRLGTVAGLIGGIETFALQKAFPQITALCERWDHPIGRDLVRQIRDVVRPEESRHVLIWRYVFHQLIAPKGSKIIDAYFQATNAGRNQLGAPAIDRETLERMLGTSAPTTRQLLGKDRALHG
jgi:hypothetical protein